MHASPSADPGHARPVSPSTFRILIVLVLGVLALWRVLYGAITGIGTELPREHRAIMEVEALVDAVRSYRAQHGKLPVELADLLRKDAQGRSGLDNLRRDPWNHDYELRRSDAPGLWEVASLGPDGVESEDDITSKIEPVK